MQVLDDGRAASPCEGSRARVSVAVADVHVQRVAVAVECAVKRIRTRTHCRRHRAYVGGHLEVLAAVGLAAVDSRREVVPVRRAGDEVGRGLGAFAREHLHGADGEAEEAVMVHRLYLVRLDSEVHAAVDIIRRQG